MKGNIITKILIKSKTHSQMRIIKNEQNFVETPTTGPGLKQQHLQKLPQTPNPNKSYNLECEIEDLRLGHIPLNAIKFWFIIC